MIYDMTLLVVEPETIFGDGDDLTAVPFTDQKEWVCRTALALSCDAEDWTGALLPLLDEAEYVTKPLRFDPRQEKEFAMRTNFQPERLKYVPASRLKVISATFADPRDRAAMAYVRELPDETPVVLWWY